MQAAGNKAFKVLLERTSDIHLRPELASFPENPSQREPPLKNMPILSPDRLSNPALRL
jgi:hypothetical protein